MRIPATEGFGSFPPPRLRLVLEGPAARAELWPELGGSVARLQARSGGAWHDVLRPTAEAERYSPKDLAAWPLLPYSGRLRAGELPVGGQVHRLPPTLAGEPLPLHGVGWIRPWHVASVDGAGARLELREPASADWPWPFEARQSFRLLGQGLEVELEFRNASAGPAPCGLGWHPYLHRAPGSKLTAAVAAAWRGDAAVLPVERIEPPPPAWALGDGRALEGLFLDNCFEGFGGEAWLERPDGRRVRVAADASARCLVVYNPVGEAFTCVEPVTHVPDSPHLPGAPGLALLAAGEVARLRCTIGLHEGQANR